MRGRLAAIGFIVLATACGSSSGATSGTGGSSGVPGGGDDGGSVTPTGNPPPGGDAGGDDGGTGDDGGGGGTPAVGYVGRFDMSDATNPNASWPGVRAIARFDGTSANVKLSQTDGFSGGPTWFDVFVDGVVGAPFSVTGASEDHVLATGLSTGAHTVELVKRTEANLGAVRFEGFTFPAGGKLLAPPARAAHKIEFLSDSTIDGYGVEGNVTTTCAGGAPAQFDDADKSTAAFASQALSAEMMLLGYSGKGVSRNEDGSTTDVFGDLYDRTLPDGSQAWSFASFTPDVVVLSLGGADFVTDNTLAAGFTAAYGSLVDTIRSHYPSAHVFCTIWSQIKTYNGARQAMETALQSVLAAHASDTKLYFYEFPEANHDTDETGCEYHANAAHHQAMGALLAAQIKAKTGW